MNGDLDNLEREVEREMELLRALPPLAPSRECVERVRSAVCAEANGAGLGWRVPRSVRIVVAAAAAVAAAVGLTWMPTGYSGTILDADAVVADWGAALEESGQLLAGLADDGWFGGIPGDNPDNDLDDLLRGLDESFERFEAL